MTDQDNLSRALKLLAAGQLDEARIYLEELLRQDSDNPDLLYNLGLCYVDLGQLDKGIELLHRCLQIAPQHSNASVALGVAYLKLGDLAYHGFYSSLKALSLTMNLRELKINKINDIFLGKGLYRLRLFR